MKKEMKIFIIANVAVVFAVALFAVFASIAIHYGVYKCAFFEAFHLYCPGCGGTRALFALLRLDILSSLKYNPVLILGIIVYLFYDVRIFMAIKKGEDGYFRNCKFRLLIAYGIFIIVHFFVRDALLLGFGIDLIGDILPKG